MIAFHIFTNGLVDALVETIAQRILHLKQQLQIVHCIIQCLQLLFRLCHSNDYCFLVAKVRQKARNDVIISQSFVIIWRNLGEMLHQIKKKKIIIAAVPGTASASCRRCA